MEDLKQQLLDGDPLAREGGLDVLDAERIRHRTLAEARTAPADRMSWWPRPLALAGAVVACMLLAIVIGTRLNVEKTRVQPPPAEAGTTRQLQFAAPGGTRIIWTFHQDLEL